MKPEIRDTTWELWGKWDVSKLPEDMRFRAVHCVRVTVRTIIKPWATPGTRPQNRWTIELLVFGGCVRLDMSLYDPASQWDTRGLLRLIGMQQQPPSNQSFYIDHHVIGTRTVGHFLDKLMSRRRQNYCMTYEKVGCRYWILVVMKDFQAAGFIGERTTGGHKLEEYMPWNWAMDSPPEPRMVHMGSFF